MSVSTIRVLHGGGGGGLGSVSLHTICPPPQIGFFTYYRWASLDIFLCILYGGPLRSVSSHSICGRGPQISFFANYMGTLFRSVCLYILCRPPPPPPYTFLCTIARRAPKKLHTIYGGPLGSVILSYLFVDPSDQFRRILYRGRSPLISFF